jgi:hypothetical protein
MTVRLVRTSYNHNLQAAHYGTPDGRFEITPTVQGWGAGKRAWRLRDTSGRHVFSNGRTERVFATLGSVRTVIAGIIETEAQQVRS